MKRMLLIGSLLLALQLAFAGLASAATYDSGSDQSVNVDAPLALPSLNTGNLTFDAQQSLYTNVVNPLGASYSYHYDWIDVNGVPILALDPMRIGF